MMDFGQEACIWLSRATEIPLDDLEALRLKGANSSLVFLVQDLTAAQSGRFVLRVIDNQQWLAEEPDLIIHEASALEAAYKMGLSAPRLIDYASDDIGFGGPALLMSCLEGAVQICPTDFEGWLKGLAANLASIHQHKAERFPWMFDSWVNKPALAVPEWTRTPVAWERAIQRSLGPEPEYHPVFIHRDYHPVNVLWSDEAISGTVDWVNACRGPANVDVAHCRTNLAQMFGVEAADRFLDFYTQSSNDFEYEPYWDIESVLDMNLPEPEFYKPWSEFGLKVIPSDLLARRMDEYLLSVVKRL